MAINKLTDTFQLDGNQAFADGSPKPDWQSVFAGTSGAFQRFAVSDPSPQSTFSGGSKDIQPISDWGSRSGNVPGKADIINAYAAAFTSGSDTIVTFGADLGFDSGDVNIGIWFFQNTITDVGGRFTGTHVNNDLFLVAELAGNGGVVVTVYKWQGSGLSAPATFTDARCDPSKDQLVCGTLNFNSAIPLFFPAGTTVQAPITTFFEGAINLNQIFTGTPPCFNSFLINTRSSTSTTATLKDFVLTGFNLCSSNANITCPQLAVDGVQAPYKATVTVKVTNSGISTLTNVQVVPVSPPSASSNTGAQNIAAGATATFVLTYAVNDASQNFPVSVKVTYGGGVLPDKPLSTTCPLLAQPAIVITKSCSVAFKDGDASSNGKLYIQLTASGTVRNSGNVALEGITLSDSRVDGSTVNSAVILRSAPTGGSVITTLATGATGYYSYIYNPVHVNSQSSSTTCLTFSDTIGVTATSNPGGLTATDSESASCSPCS